MKQPRWVKITLSIVGVLLILGSIVFLLRDQIFLHFFRPTKSSIEHGTQSDDAELEVIADDLEVPWDITFLPGGDVLVTERGGKLQRIGDNARTFEIDGVAAEGESGLLGAAVHPDFAENNFVYLYKTIRKGGVLTNQVERYVLESDSLQDQRVMVDDIPGAWIHDGGRMAFGPDGLLYIGTGDANAAELAQDENSLAGKILRVTDEGAIPASNPFGNAVYSLGHRNIQGLAWDDDGRLWATEHGSNAQDEINLIEAGKNYGWPVITGDKTSAGMEVPKRHSGVQETWAPSGLAYAGGSLFFGGLRGQTLYEAVLDDANVVDMRAHFSEDYGRLRAVKSQDEFLYFSTSNRDGRGEPRSDDDKIIRAKSDIF